MAQNTNPSFKQEIEQAFARQLVMKLIGAELSRVQPGIVELNLPYRSNLTQQDGYVHAGIVTTIVDSACGFAAFSLMPTGSAVLSVEFKVNFLRPARGSHFIARGEVVKPGRTLTVVHGEVLAFSEGGEQELIATMQGTMMCLQRT